MGQNGSQYSDTSDDKLDAFSVIWLDAEINKSQDNQQNKTQFEKSFKNVKTYENAETCGTYIRCRPQDEKIILIVSGRLGQSLVPNIHSLPSVQSIYVYCANSDSHERWTSQYPKIKNVVTDWNELIDWIKFDHQMGAHDRIHGSLPISIFDPSLIYKKLTVDFQDNLVQSPLLINSLYMRPRSRDSQELVSFCKTLYKENADKRKTIGEFEKDYSTETALSWYTRDSFLTRLLNKALQTQNMTHLLLFHFFIMDMQNQLKGIDDRPKIVYRSQFMPNNQLDKLQKTIGKFISINSFLSAYTRNRALDYLGQNEPLEKVLLEIHADPKFVGNKPYANISKYSTDGKEEVLFMVGSIFKIEQCQRDGNGVWVFQLRLYPDDSQLIGLISNDSNELLAFGHVLETIGKVEEAETFYRHVLDKILDNNSNIARLYEAIAGVADEKGEYDASLRFYEKALKQNLASKRSNLVIASNYNDIGEVYRKGKNDDEALAYHEKALETLDKTDTSKNLFKRAVFYNSMGVTFQSQKKYREALECYMKAFNIRQDHFSWDEISLGMSCNNIGNAYYYLGLFDDAEFHYKEALKYYKKRLPRMHPKIASTYNNLGAVYQKQGKLDEAYNNYIDALRIYDGIYSDTHPYVEQIWKNIDALKKRMDK